MLWCFMGLMHSVRFCALQGPAMEDEIMETVLHLMDNMKAVGVGKTEFHALLDALGSNPDTVLSDVRTVSLTKAFDAKQASTLVSRIGTISPFDQMEAAVMLYDALISKHSFNLVLDVFEEDADRDNVCHRLGVIRNPDGSFKHLPSRSRVVQADATPPVAAAASGGGHK